MNFCVGMFLIRCYCYWSLIREVLPAARGFQKSIFHLASLFILFVRDVKLHRSEVKECFGNRYHFEFRKLNCS